jgi:hypothetical protein
VTPHSAVDNAPALVVGREPGLFQSEGHGW